jgi:hypothetical protein
MEEWRTIDICPAYEVSSLGRIKRVLPGKRTRVGAKLKDSDIADIKERFSNGETLTAIGKHYGVYYTTIRKIIDGRTWKHLGCSALAFPSPVDAEIGVG